MDNLGFVEQAIKRLKHLKHLSSFPLFDVRLKVRHSKICPAPATATDGCEITWQARTGGQQQTDEITGQAFIYSSIIQHGGSPPIGTGPHADASDHHHLTPHHSTHLKVIAARDERFDLGGV
jgi:hypothetical protein